MEHIGHFPRQIFDFPRPSTAIDFRPKILDNRGIPRQVRALPRATAENAEIISLTTVTS